MHITELTAYHVRIPLRSTIRHASFTRDANDTLIVSCRLDDGTTGWGEGLPRPYVTGETIETAFDHLRATDLVGQLGERFSDLAGAIELSRNFRLTTNAPSARDCFGNSVRCALELSILDAGARAVGQPLSTVTQLVPEAAGIREAKEQARYSAAFTAMSPWKEYVRALKLRYYQFHQTKMKVGLSDESDVATLRRIRRVLGKNVDIRIDANEAWTCNNIESKLKPLLPYVVTALEQPVPHADVAGLSAVRGQIPVPIMLDESLCSISDAYRAIEQGTCDLFNIRLSKCGGFINSLTLAAIAHNAGLGFQLGCQVGETGILSAAGRHFATSIGNIRYLEGSFDRFLVKERLTIEDITFGRGGYAPALTGPGLGVNIDLQALERVTIGREPWKFA